MIQTLKFENLSFKYEGSANWIFEDTSFDFPMNQFVKIETSGGSGKSTLLRLLAGLIDPLSGSYYINDKNISEMSFEEFLPLRLQIGYSFDLGGLLNNRSLAENIALPLVYHKICSFKEVDTRVDEMLEIFELHKVADQRPSAVRGSERKSTILARALVMHPQVLLLDDPTTGLSLGITERLVSEIKRQQLHQNLKHIFISTDDAKILSEFDVSKIQIGESKIYSPETDLNYKSSEAA